MIACNICDRDCKTRFDNVEALIRHLKFFHPRESSCDCIYVTWMRHFTSIYTLKRHLSVCTSNGSVKKSKLEKKSCLQEFSKLDGIPSNSSDDVGQRDFKYEDNVDDLENEILQFMGFLYSRNSSQRSLVQEIFEKFIDLTRVMTSQFFKKLKRNIPEEFHDSIDPCLEVNILDELGTEHKRFKYLSENELFIKPWSFYIDEMEDEKRSMVQLSWPKKNAMDR